MLLLAIVAALSSLKPNLQRQVYFDQYELNVAFGYLKAYVTGRLHPTPSRATDETEIYL